MSHTFNFQPKVHIDWRDFRIKIGSTMLTFYFDIYVVCWISIIRPNLYRFHDIKRTYIQIKNNCVHASCCNHPKWYVDRTRLCVLVDFWYWYWNFQILWLRSYKFASHPLHMYLLYFSLAISAHYMHCAYLFAKYCQMARFFPLSLSICCCLLLHIIEWFEVFFSINSRLLHVRF